MIHTITASITISITHDVMTPHRTFATILSTMSIQYTQTEMKNRIVKAPRPQSIGVTEGKGIPMQAIVIHQYSLPDVLELAEVPKPTPKDHEVLVRSMLHPPMPGTGT
ncbi:MAG: hypothetical protein R3E79_60500 [Caldilineaceae bacterium]